MTYRLKLSDGTTTLDLLTLATGYHAREGGLNIGLPEVTSQWIDNPFFDGAQLVSQRYGKRKITIKLRLAADSKTALIALVQILQQLLIDAADHHIRGYGAGVTLQYQWGNTANYNTLFDVISGSLDLGDKFFSAALQNKYQILEATLTLITQPFGRREILTANNTVLTNVDSGADHNYEDHLEGTAHIIDVPTPIYWRLTPTGATGTTKVWLAKRSGSRRTDALWTEGEVEDSFTNLVGGAHTVTNVDEVDAACSGGNTHYVKIVAAGGVGPAVVGYLQYDIATPPRGTFRVLARVKRYSVGGANPDAQQIGMGWSYGNRTFTPAVARGEYYDTDTAYQVLDLGLLKLPPVGESDIATNSTFSLRLYCYLQSAIAVTNQRYWYVDYIFLFPIDEECMIINDVGATDVIAIDNLSRPPGVFLLDGSDKIIDTPDYVGSPFTLGREDTRLYMLRDDAIDMYYTSYTTYYKLFMFNRY